MAVAEAAVIGEGSPLPLPRSNPLRVNTPVTMNEVAAAKRTLCPEIPIDIEWDHDKRPTILGTTGPAAKQHSRPGLIRDVDAALTLVGASRSANRETVHIWPGAAEPMLDNSGSSDPGDAPKAKPLQGCYRVSRDGR